MLDDIARRWWALVLRGCAAIIFAIAAVLWPGLTITILIVLFGAYTLVNGLFTVIGAVLTLGRDRYWWLSLLDGVISLATGLVVIFWPRLTALALAYLIAAFAIATGVTQIVAAIRLRQVLTGEWILGLCGAFSILFGLLIAIFPRTGALAVIYIIAAYAILFGGLLIALGLKARNWASQTRTYAGI